MGTIGRLHVRVQANRLAIGEAVAAAIEEAAGLPVVADTTDPTQVHRARRRPDVVVVIGSRVDASTSAAVKTARRRWPQALVIALAETERVEDGVALVRQGADAWLAPNDGLDVLRTMLSRIADGERVLLSPSALAAIAASLSQPSPSPGDANGILTSRESQVLQCFAQGMSRPEIAARLKISRATLRTHVQNILHKLDLHSIDHAASLAARADPDWSPSAGVGVGRAVAAVRAAPDGA